VIDVYVYHSDLSWYVSDCAVSVSLRRVICLTVIYHAMSLTTVVILIQ
jgi:hypothetical protein